MSEGKSKVRRKGAPIEETSFAQYLSSRQVERKAQSDGVVVCW